MGRPAPGTGRRPSGRADAALASELYRPVRRPRGRELELDPAILHDAVFWALNSRDCADSPRLRLR